MIPPIEATPAYLERQYNARAAIPEHQEIFERWQRDSAKARTALPCFLDRRYGDGPGETLDIFPARRESRATLLFIHGGFWRSRDKSEFSFLAPAFVEAGITVAINNHDLMPHTTMEEIVRQNLRAAAWLWRNAADYGAGRERVFVCGHSAGGHLAAMLLAAEWPRVAANLPRNLVKGCLAISGLFDLEPVARTPFLAADLKLDAAAARMLSPISYPPATGAPLYTAVGGLESEEFKRQSALIARHWKHNFVRDVAMPGANHLTVLDGLTERKGALFGAVLEMMELA